MTTIAPPRASPCLPTTLPVITADCAAALWNAAPSNTSSAPAQAAAPNVRGLIMTPPSVGKVVHLGSQRLGLGAQRLRAASIVHQGGKVRKTTGPPARGPPESAARPKPRDAAILCAAQGKLYCETGVAGQPSGPWRRASTPP